MLEIVSVKCLDCEQIIPAQDMKKHSCWQDVRKLEQDAWDVYQSNPCICGNPEWIKDIQEVRKRAIANGKALDLPEEEYEDFSSSEYYFDECYHKDSDPCDCLKEAYRAWRAYQSEDLDPRKREF